MGTRSEEVGVRSNSKKLAVEMLRSCCAGKSFFIC